MIIQLESSEDEWDPPPQIIKQHSKQMKLSITHLFCKYLVILSAATGFSVYIAIKSKSKGLSLMAVTTSVVFIGYLCDIGDLRFRIIRTISKHI